MNNKKLGTMFEREMCGLLAKDGWWVHFISPKENGSQPFDVIAVRNSVAIAIDCKTCASKIFSFDRLEDNQIMAFEKWLACGNPMPIIAVKYKDRVITLTYQEVKEKKLVNLEECQVWKYL